MHRVRKYFRGSGRALAFIFVASIIWLIFDMAALRFSFNELNGKLRREELFKREQGDSGPWKPIGRVNVHRKWGNGGQPWGEDTTKLKGIFHPPGNELGKAGPIAMYRQRKRTIKPMAINKTIPPMSAHKLVTFGGDSEVKGDKLQAANVTKGLEAKAHLSKAPAKENVILKQQATASVLREGKEHNVEKPVEAMKFKGKMKVGGADDSKSLDASRDGIGGIGVEAGAKDALEGKNGTPRDKAASKDAVQSKGDDTSKVQMKLKDAEAPKKEGGPLDSDHAVEPKDAIEARDARALEHVVVAKDIENPKVDVGASKDAEKIKDVGVNRVIEGVKGADVSKVVVKEKEGEVSRVVVKDAEIPKGVVKEKDGYVSKVLEKGNVGGVPKDVVKDKDGEVPKDVVKDKDGEVSNVKVKDNNAIDSKIAVEGKAAGGSQDKAKVEGPPATQKPGRLKGQSLENQHPDQIVIVAEKLNVSVINKAGAVGNLSVNANDAKAQETVKKLNISEGAILQATHGAGVDSKNSSHGFKKGFVGESESVKVSLTNNITHKLANVNISSSINADVENKQLIHHDKVSRVPGTGKHKVRTLDVTMRPRDINAPGQFGRPHAVPKEKEQEANKRWKEGNFNVYLSDIIPLDRAIEDTRPKGCSNQLVHDDLPSTSIIICFVDEVWSTLLRSVFSVLNRSPPELIKEIILVDDFSTKAYLKENLDEYMKQYPKVRILHLKERNGLIRARIAGANIATGDVLTFLDSHVECNVGWLEPLLEQVRINRKKVACPVIEVISDKDMSYMTVDNFQRGVFSWPMNFGWKPIPTEVLQRNKITDKDPIKCPVMAGGLFSIDKKYFYELGTYDPGLDVWGGENMEISFKIWMCGGEIEIIPCSRVGHIFRNDNPYSFPKDRVKTVERNLARVAEVWLDEYKELFYGHGYHLLQEISNIGDLTQQKELRRNLKCKSFKWYLDNVFPDLDAPLVRASGVIANVALGKCLSLQNSSLTLDTCDASKMNQHFTFSWLRQIKQRDLCIAPGDKDKLALWQCDNMNNNLRWLHKSLTGFQPSLESHLVLESIPRPTCLEVDPSHKTLRTNACNPANNLQKWQFEKYFAP
ncbi:polypeptide N-acetylgalactosaminyltransferase 5 [Pyxicephalus adspersus]|uniref:polypeptide N-acetylgalactosaminyltransferase 5 n=1 Tax=Pyxicephalus adspersus TaxID=30357 RepID=UPI003B5A9E54